MAASPEPPTDGQPVDVGHHQVQDHDIGALSSEGVQRRGAVADRLDVIAIELQRADQRLTRGSIIFGQQDASRHVRVLSRLGETRVRITKPRMSDRVGPSCLILQRAHPGPYLAPSGSHLPSITEVTHQRRNRRPV